jgi:hypothetical protein
MTRQEAIDEAARCVRRAFGEGPGTDCVPGQGKEAMSTARVVKKIKLSQFLKLLRDLYEANKYDGGAKFNGHRF